MEPINAILQATDARSVDPRLTTSDETFAARKAAVDSRIGRPLRSAQLLEWKPARRYELGKDVVHEAEQMSIQ